MLNVNDKKKSSIKRDKVLKYANQKLPEFPKNIAGLEEYSDNWNFENAAHLLRRTCFGPKLSEINQAITLGLNESIDKLLNEEEFTPDPPLNDRDDDENAPPIGETWVNILENKNNDFIQKKSYEAWRISLILNQPHQSPNNVPFSIREKMVLFWQNHFATEATVVRDSRYIYWMNYRLRENFIGNFKTLVKEINVDASMLVYLGGIYNVKESPNENYARELLELFTIGKGPVDGEDSYTYYTEEDIIQAAKVLTGWYVEDVFSGSERQRFEEENHDKTTKIFSEKFNNKSIQNNYEDEHKDLVDMIFENERTSEYICEKIYRWFVYYAIDEDVTSKIIKPLAKVLRDNNYEIKPVLSKLFRSQHFFEIHTRGAMIKSPSDFNLSVLRQIPFSDTSSFDFRDLYRFWRNRGYDISNQGQDLLDSPNVAGWPAYYQDPLYNELWINAVTLPMRTRDISIYFRDSGINATSGEPGAPEDVRIYAEPIKLLDEIEKPDDIDFMIELFCKWLFPVYSEISDEQKEEFKNIVIGNNPNMWYDEYHAYINNPTDEAKTAINKKLKTLFKEMCLMPEYHLS
jgi:uncharacterized protein (DUF1800 family)